MKQKTREAVSGLSFVAVSLLGMLFFSVAPYYNINWLEPRAASLGFHPSHA